MPYINVEGKITLRELKRRHSLSTYAIAAIANVEPGLIYWMEQGGSLSAKDAENILTRLSQVTGQHYSIETVGGYWIKEE